MATYRSNSSDHRTPRAPGLLFGIGLGGFVDGIVLHQILQWHHMLSATAPHPVSTVTGLELNTLVDGFFHVFTWLCVLAASVMTVRVWRQGRLSPTYRSHVGLLLVGWGLFNVVEGIVDHQLLGIHHVRDDLGGPLSWDIGFLVFGTLLIIGGWLLVRSGDRRGMHDTPSESVAWQQEGNRKQ